MKFLKTQKRRSQNIKCLDVLCIIFSFDIPAPPTFLYFGQIVPHTPFCVEADFSHEEVVKLLSGKVLYVFWRSNGEGGRRRDLLMEGK